MITFGCRIKSFSLLWLAPYHHTVRYNTIKYVKKRKKKNVKTMYKKRKEKENKKENGSTVFFLLMILLSTYFIITNQWQELVQALVE